MFSKRICFASAPGVSNTSTVIVPTGMVSEKNESTDVGSKRACMNGFISSGCFISSDISYLYTWKCIT